MNNKGFTLVELLAVIVLLAVISTMAVPSIMGISKKIKENMLETKRDLIKENAKLYGEDNLSEIASSSLSARLNGSNLNYNCKMVTIAYLVEEGYISLDEEDEGGKVINPVDNSDMSNLNLILYIKNKRVIAKFETEEEKDDSGEKVENQYSCY